jgi:hypothetical protein
VQTWSTGASAAAATTPPAPWTHSPPACASRSTSTRSPAEPLAVIEQTMQPGQASLWLGPVAATAKPVAAHTSSQTMLACQPDAQDR